MTTTVLTGLFYVLAACSVLLALAVVTTRRILRAAVYLMGVLLMSAGFFLLLGAEFLAGVQILVYVGGIVVLLVFAVMLTRSVELLEEEPGIGRKLLAYVVAAGFLIMNVALLATTEFRVLREGALPTNNTAALGRKLLDYGPQGYALPFEVLSILLLAAMIGGIVIARKTGRVEVTGKLEQPGQADADRFGAQTTTIQGS
ncbi:MAG TPA: NADH-quinone oxidoreductase subunit J [Bdellovibrionota bacterium]|nr:NADH-quinone oxidoreductase subunit J [Bdellovibrionota bacterium]